MRLYKYLSPERVDVLRNERIRFSQPTVFNDPFELSHIVDSIYGSGVNTLEQALANTKLGNALLGAVGEVASEGLRQHFANQLGVLSLAERPDNLLMWAHYATSHEGFVLELDATHVFFNRQKSDGDRVRRLEKVAYSQTRPSIALASYNAVHALLVKSLEWEYEQEWRMVLPLEESVQTIETQSPPIHLFALPPQVVTNVILGCRMSDAHRDEILGMLAGEERYAHVTTQQAELDDRSFTLRLVESPHFYGQKALKAIQERRFDDALVHAKRAIEVAPRADKGRHYGGRAMVRLHMGDQRGFADDMAQVKKHSPHVYENLLKAARARQSKEVNS